VERVPDPRWQKNQNKKEGKKGDVMYRFKKKPFLPAGLLNVEKFYLPHSHTNIHPPNLILPANTPRI
jgi:hypothetical protein